MSHVRSRTINFSSNLKIRTKLIFSFLIISALIAIYGAIAINSIKTLALRQHRYKLNSTMK